MDVSGGPSATGTPHRAAAPASSICRAAAPTLRIGRKKWRTLLEPTMKEQFFALVYVAGVVTGCRT
jgi:hypothetical protein